MAYIHNFYEVVSDVFADIIKEYNLSVVEIDGYEVLIYSDSFVILAWADRDGLTLQYADLDVPGRLKVVCLGAFLGMKRRFHRDVLGPEGTDYASTIRHHLLMYAKTLSLEGQDILRGDKAWLSDAIGRPFELSEKGDQDIRSAIQKDRDCCNGQNEL